MIYHRCTLFVVFMPMSVNGIIFIIVLQIIDSSSAAIHGIMNCIDTGIKFISEETYEWICCT